MDEKELAKPYAHTDTICTSKEHQDFWINDSTNKVQAKEIKLLESKIDKLESNNAELKAQIEILMRVIKGS